MAARFALSWCRPSWAAQKLHKPPGRTVSHYHSTDIVSVAWTAVHINSLNPDMDCDVEVIIDRRTA